MLQEAFEDRLRSAVEKTAPDDIADVFARIDAGKVVPIEEARASRRPRLGRLIAACFALILLGGAGFAYQRANAVSSVVSIDVNPSIELRVNANERVLDCSPMNEDAARVLAEMDGGRDLKNTKLDVAVNALVGSLLRHGYLDSLSSSILISVEDNNAARGERLRQTLADEVDGIVKQATVLSRAYAKDAARDDLAKQSSVSSGKAAFVQEVRALNEALDFDALAALSVEELRGMSETGAPAMPIGRAEAARIAAAFAGADGGIPREVESELDENPPHYEVEFAHPTLGELEYRVHAYTGEVIGGKKNALKDSAVSKAEEKQQKTADKAEEKQQKTADKAEEKQQKTADKAEEKQQKTADKAEEKQRKAAEKAVLKRAGFKASQVHDLHTHRDTEDGRAVYEVEFIANGIEYEYKVDAATGEILGWEAEPEEKDPDDDTDPDDDNDTDDDFDDEDDPDDDFDEDDPDDNDPDDDLDDDDKDPDDDQDEDDDKDD